MDRHEKWGYFLWGVPDWQAPVTYRWTESVSTTDGLAMPAFNSPLSDASLAGFRSPHPVILQPSPRGSDSSGVTGPLGFSGTVEERSRFLGKAIARRCGVDIRHPFFAGPSTRGKGDDPELSTASSGVQSDPRCIAGLEQLINKACFSRSESTTSPSPVAKAFTFWLGSVLEWAWSCTSSWDSTIRQASLLKPLMPLYQACVFANPSDESIRANALARTRHLAMELVGLVDLHRSLESVGFADWLNQRAEDLTRSVQETFQINLFLITRAVQEQPTGTCETVQRPRFSEHPISDSEHALWWSLALQWSRAKTSFLVPRDWSDAEITWEPWLLHWKEISSSFEGQSLDSQRRFVELRSFSDNTYAACLNRLLDNVRSEQGTLTLVTLRYLGDISSHPSATEAIAWWQTEYLQSLEFAIHAAAPEGFVRDSSELGLFFRDSDRTEMSQMVRDALANMQRTLVNQGVVEDGLPVPMIAGIASVDGPARSFRISQLLDAADRCLANAASQGPGTVKSIEVF